MASNIGDVDYQDSSSDSLATGFGLTLAGYIVCTVNKNFDVKFSLTELFQMDTLESLSRRLYSYGRSPKDAAASGDELGLIEWKAETALPESLAVQPPKPQQAPICRASERRKKCSSPSASTGRRPSQELARLRST